MTRLVNLFVLVGRQKFSTCLWWIRLMALLTLSSSMAQSVTSSASSISPRDPETCLTCHEKFAKGQVVHQAVKDSCMDCHGEMESPYQTPHKSKGKFKNGLSAAVPELCYGCHAKKNFSGKLNHDPAFTGECAECHNPHGSDNFALLTKSPSESCAECHASLKKQKHVLAGISGKGHPVGLEGRTQPVEDPLRPGKPFYCGSCHESHRGDFDKLLRHDPKLGMQVCSKCHEM